MRYWQWYLWVIVIMSAQNIWAEGTAPTVAALKGASTYDLEKSLQSIEQELAMRTTRIDRIKTTESNLKSLANKKSWKKAIVGSVITGAVTAHPVGLLVGGIVGAFVGRSEKYEKIEEKIAEMEQEIIVDEDDFLTAEEIRLANFAGDAIPAVYDDPENGIFQEPVMVQVLEPELDYEKQEPPATINKKGEPPKMATLIPPKKPAPVEAQNNAGTAGQAVVFGGAQAASLDVAMNTPPEEPKVAPKADLTSCYQQSQGNGVKRSRREEIRALPHCFYMIY